VERSTVTSEQCVALEPALATQAHRIVGATYTGSDESGDAGKFTQQLARMAADAGVSFRYGVTVDRLHAAGDVLTRVDITQADGRRDTLAGDAYVAALGSYTPLLVRPLGVPCPVYPLKGYSVTLPVVDAVRAPSVSVTDDARKIVISRLGERLRAAGTAELNGYNLELNTVRCAALTQCVTQWFGDSVDASAPDYWTGLRPATPSNVPLIGRTRYANLFLNTGHGTLGWTMSCGSAKALTAIMGGQAPDIGFRFLGSAS
jgi:D-amino-acid dehydrogenase